MVDAGEKLLAAVEALHAEIKANTAEIRGMREEMRADRADRESLARLRKAAAERKARQRSASRDCHATEQLAKPDSGTVTGHESRDSHGTGQVVNTQDQATRTKNLPAPVTVTGQETVTGQPEVGRTVETRKAYEAAYLARWKANPLINKTTNGMLGKFVDLVGAEAAPKVAAFYLRHNQQLYVAAKHPIPLLLRDASKLHTEWVTNSPDVSPLRAPPRGPGQAGGATKVPSQEQFDEDERRHEERRQAERRP